jgi:hypothetical protein
MDMKGAVNLADKAVENKMDQMDEMVCNLVNFEAFIMEKCLKAAVALAERNLTEMGHTTHGPDAAIGGQGGGAASNPAVPLMATRLYQQVRTSLREGPGHDAKPPIG